MALNLLSTLLVRVIFCAILLKIGPAIIVTGMAIIIPYNRTCPKFAFNSLAMTTGPGCGGKKPCHC